MLATNDAILNCKAPTSFVLNLAQPVLGADHPSGPYAYSEASQM